MGEAAVFGLPQKGVAGGLLGGDFGGRVLRQRFEPGDGGETVGIGQAQQMLAVEQVSLQLLEPGGVGLCKGFADGFVVAGKRLERLFGDAVLQRLEVGETEQGIAHLQVMVKKAQGVAFFKTFQPQSGARQFDGHGIAVHAEDAAGDDLAHGVAVVLRLHRTIGGPQLGELFGQTARGGQQKMAAAAGGVDHSDGKQGR